MLNKKFCIIEKSSSEKPLDKPHKDKVVQDYFQETTANKYIKTILNDQNKAYLTNRDVEALKESYDKAHDIRKFEIELYWKRTAYVWTLIASLITVTGLLLAAYYRLPAESDGRNALLGVVAIIAVLGVLITVIASKIILGGEYWQKNWEYHVSLLEPLFSGRIYSTLVNLKEKRHSISKLNRALYFLFLGVWLLVAEGVYFVVFPNTDKNNSLILLVVFSCLVLIASYVINLWTFRKPGKYHVSISSWEIDFKNNDAVASRSTVNTTNTKMDFFIKVKVFITEMLKFILLLALVLISLSVLYNMHVK